MSIYSTQTQTRSSIKSSLLKNETNWYNLTTRVNQHQRTSAKSNVKQNIQNVNWQKTTKTNSQEDTQHELTEGHTGIQVRVTADSRRRPASQLVDRPVPMVKLQVIPDTGLRWAGLNPFWVKQQKRKDEIPVPRGSVSQVLAALLTKTLANKSNGNASLVL